MSTLLDFSDTIAAMASEQTGSDSAFVQQFATEKASGIYNVAGMAALSLGGFFAHGYGKVGKTDGTLDVIRALVRSGIITGEQRDAVRFGRYAKSGDVSRSTIHETIAAAVAGMAPAKKARR